MQRPPVERKQNFFRDLQVDEMFGSLEAGEPGAG